MSRLHWPTKVNIGCGYDKRLGYLNLDVDQACKPDLLVKDHDLSVLPQSHFEEVLAHDVLEHIPRAFTMAVLLDWAALLKPGGSLVLKTSSILGVADLMRANPTFEFEFNWTGCLFGNQQHHGDFHHTGFTEKTLRVYLEAAGFEVPGFDLVDGWLLATTAIKRRDWTELLKDKDMIAKAYRQYFTRDIDDIGRAHFGAMPARDALKGIIESPEHLYKLAARLGL